MSGALPERRFSIITLGVDDRAGMTRFYEDVVGLRNVGPPTMAAFDCGGVALCLWERAKLAEDAGLPDAAAKAGAFKGFTIAYNARSREEVDAVFARLGEAGARISKAPHATFWGGYSGYFLDPEGNAWEVAHNPFWPIDAEGRISIPASSA